MNLLLGDSFFLEFPKWFSVKNPSAMKETQKGQVWSLGQEDRLEEEMATHSGSLAWKIPGHYSSCGHRVRPNWAGTHAFILSQKRIRV